MKVRIEMMAHPVFLFSLEAQGFTDVFTIYLYKIYLPTAFEQEIRR